MLFLWHNALSCKQFSDCSMHNQPLQVCWIKWVIQVPFWLPNPSISFFRTLTRVCLPAGRTSHGLVTVLTHSLYEDDISGSNCVASKGGLGNKQRTSYEAEWSVQRLRSLSWNLPGGTEVKHANRTQYSRSLGLQPNPASPWYASMAIYATATCRQW